MYFMQEAGESKKLRIVKGLHGPYAENLRHVLRASEDYYLPGYREGDAPVTPLELLPGSVEDSQRTLDDTPRTLARFERVAQLVDGFESPFGLELLATGST